MNTLATLGHFDPSIQYTNRPTVKVIIKKENEVLILNRGLLPGGGVDAGESDHDAISRELVEELGVTVKDITEIGTVIQYRNFLGKKYLVNGYVATLATGGGLTNPQDEGEANFSKRWLGVEEAVKLVEASIGDMKLKPMDDDANQGRLYNLTTTLRLLRALN